MTDRELLLAAIEARREGYTPYSHFRVGAALLTADGKIYTGANIENAAYSPGVCAERVAIFKAVNAGERTFKKIAVVGGPEDGPIAPLCAPCGVCRQVMAEFCRPDFEVLLSDGKAVTVLTLGELLPHGFGPEHL